MSKNDLASYLPDQISSDSLTRGFLLKIIYHRDKNKFSQLENLTKNINEFRKNPNSNQYSVNISNLFMQELNNFNSIHNMPRNSRIHSYNTNNIKNNEITLSTLNRKERRDLRRKNLNNFLNIKKTERNNFEQELKNIEDMNSNVINSNSNSGN